VWARQMIAKLRIDEGTTTTNRNHIIELSKQYQVLSDYTAFLAIQPVVVTEDNSIGQYVDVITPMAIDRLSLVSVQIIQNRLAIEASAGEYIREVVVYDLKGRCLFRKKISDLQCTKFMWDGRLSNGQMIAKGQFVIRIKTTRGRITRCMFWR
jgi:flagellar hook assembly protein FlgD